MTLYQAVYVIFYHFGSVLLHNVQIKLGKHVKKSFKNPLQERKSHLSMCQCVHA